MAKSNQMEKSEGMVSSFIASCISEPLIRWLQLSLSWPVFIPAEQVLYGVVVRGELSSAVNVSLELVAVFDLLLGSDVL